MKRLNKSEINAIKVRDDNLRLIFAPVEAVLIGERMDDVRAGATLLGIVVTETCLFTFVVFYSGMDPFPENDFVASVLGLVWILALVTTMLSPLLAGMLIVEYRNMLSRRHDQHDLLRRYGRLPLFADIVSRT